MISHGETIIRKIFKMEFIFLGVRAFWCELSSEFSSFKLNSLFVICPMFFLASLLAQVYLSKNSDPKTPNWHLCWELWELSLVLLLCITFWWSVYTLCFFFLSTYSQWRYYIFSISLSTCDSQVYLFCHSSKVVERILLNNIFVFCNNDSIWRWGFCLLPEMPSACFLRLY